MGVTNKGVEKMRVAHGNADGRAVTACVAITRYAPDETVKRELYGRIAYALHTNA